jgi:hypothetical protein
LQGWSDAEVAIGITQSIGLAGFLAAMTLAAQPAAAAPTSSRTAPPRWEVPVPKGEAIAIQALRAYSACMASVPEAPALLRTTPGTAEERAVLRALVRGGKKCRLNGQLRVLAYMLRGAIAEVLYSAEAGRRTGKLSPASPAETFSAFTARLTAAARDGPDPVDRQIFAWRWMAYCAVHRDPAATAALLRSASSGAMEIAALRALRPALEACLPQEHWADLRAVTIRALVAEALFQRLLVAP